MASGSAKREDPLHTLLYGPLHRWRAPLDTVCECLKEIAGTRQAVEDWWFMPIVVGLASWRLREIGHPAATLLLGLAIAMAIEARMREDERVAARVPNERA